MSVVSSRLAPVLLAVAAGLLAGCGLGPVEIRHGPVEGFAPVTLPGAPPLRVEARETRATDRIRLDTIIEGRAVDRRSGFVFTNDVAAEFRDALSAALRQRGLAVAAPGADAPVTIDVAIGTADGRLEATRPGVGMTAVPTGPGSTMIVPTGTWQQMLDMGIGVRVSLRDRFGRMLFDRPYEHRTRAGLALTPTVETQAKTALERSLREVVRRIANDPALLEALAAAGRP